MKTPELLLESHLQQVNGEDVVLTRGGQAIPILSEFEEDELYWQARENDPEFIASLAKARDEIAQRKGIPLEQVKKELGID